MKNGIFYCLVERERGREKWWGPQVFSPPPSKYNISKLERKLEWKVEKIFGQNCSHLRFWFFFFFFFFYFSFLTLACSFFFLFYFISFDFSFVTLAFCFLFLYSSVLSGGGFFFFSFFFFLNFYFYYFFKKTIFKDFLCYFLKYPLSSIHNFF